MTCFSKILKKKTIDMPTPFLKLIFILKKGVGWS